MERQRNHRRALKDIGNIIASLPKCNITKRSLAPAVGKLGATLAKSQYVVENAPPAEETEEHSILGSLQKTRRRKDMQHGVGSCSSPMKHCNALESAPCVGNVNVYQPTFLGKEIETEMIDLTCQTEDDDECCEMEIDRAEDPITDIDEEDTGNPLAVVDYVHDIHKFYHETEVLSCVPSDYMSHQPDINEKMRAILVDWIIKVHLEFKLMPETLFLIINIFDRYLSRQTVARKSLQLVAVAAMLVACKYEETHVPLVDDFIYITNNAYTRAELVHMEKSMLNKLKFYVSLPTPYVFMKRYLKAAGSDKHLEMVSFFLMELCLVEYTMLEYPPSLLAAAAVYTGQCTLKMAPSWTRTMECYTTYTEDQLIICAKLMVRFHQSASQGNLTEVHKKYSIPQYHCVAKLEPAIFLEENN